MNKKIILRPIPACLAAWLMPCALAGLLTPGLAVANPVGGAVAAGQIGISSPNGSTLVINQASQGAIINWQQFNIASGETVIFNQPNASAAVLNRVIGGISPSEIFGNLSANGNVFIVNPLGVVFGAGAQVDVGGLVATTANIADQDFLAGRYVFTGGTTAPVTNAGNISAAQNGFVVLAGDYVNNTGVIQAKLGTVALASGSAITLDMNGDGLVSLSVDQAALSSRAGVANLGTLAAQGGTVIMTAAVAQNLASTAVNNSGIVNASGIEEQGGNIYLTAQGGNVVNSGTLSARGGSGLNGGAINVSSDGNVLLTDSSNIDASGASGGTLHAVAGQVLTLEQGATTTVANTGSSGYGGFAELSGHSVNIGSVVDLGRDGQLLIDPVDIIIGNCEEDDGCNSYYSPGELQYQLQNSGSGATVYIVASNSITVNSLASYGGTLDGRNEGSGSGLFLGIGSCNETCTNASYGGTVSTSGVGFNPGGTSSSFITFLTNTNTIAADGSIGINAGNGAINIGNLISNGGVTLNAGQGITTGNLTGGGIALTAGQGISSGALTANGGGMTLSAGQGIATGNLAVNGGNSLSMTAGQDIQFGTLTTAATTGTAAVTINSTGGGVNGGAVSVSSPDADAHVSITAVNDIVLGGALSVQGSGTGDETGTTASATLTSSSGNITLGSGVAITASNISDTPSGDATLSLSGNTISIGELSVQPNDDSDFAVQVSSQGGNVLADFEGSASLGANIEEITHLSKAGFVSYGMSLSAGNGVTLEGNLTANDVQIQATNGDVVIPAILNTNSLSVTSTNGNIDLTGSNITVGTGVATFGTDTPLLTALNNGLANPGANVPPAMSGESPTGPNAAFSAVNGVVTLGSSLTMIGDYLYIQTSNVYNANVNLFHSGGPLFFDTVYTQDAYLNASFYETLADNYATNNAPPTMTNTSSSVAMGPKDTTVTTPPVLTLVFGSSTSTQSIDSGGTARAPVDVSSTTTNFIFASNSPGVITSESYILTQGQIATLVDGVLTIVTPATGPSSTPTQPTSNLPALQQQAADTTGNIIDAITNLNGQNKNNNPDNGFDNWLNGNIDPIETHISDPLRGKGCSN